MKNVFGSMICLIFLLLLLAPASAEQWKQIHKDEDVEIYVDRDSVRWPDKDHVDVRVKVVGTDWKSIEQVVLSRDRQQKVLRLRWWHNGELGNDSGKIDDSPEPIRTETTNDTVWRHYFDK